MAEERIDLKKEQQATLARPCRRYSFPARLFFAAFDLLTGGRTTLAKAMLLEILAAIPYRAWEIRQYQKLSGSYASEERRGKGLRLLDWARKAQDNEYQHLLVLHEKINEERLGRPWFLCPAVAGLMVFAYRLLSWALAKLSLRRAIYFNAEFEDHAERVYAEFVSAHPEWEGQPANGPLAETYGSFASWADLFRRMSWTSATTAIPVSCFVAAPRMWCVTRACLKIGRHSRSAGAAVVRPGFEKSGRFC